MMSGISSSISSMASTLFAKLDTKQQGYIEQTDLATAFSKISGNSGNVEEMFSTLDEDSDGKLTQSELTSSLTKLAEQLDNQFNSLRMEQAMSSMGGPGGPGGSGGMPPPPPENDEGFTEDELSAQLEEIGSSDSKRSSLISSVLENFDEADTDGDGKVSFKEAMAYDQASSSVGSTSSTSSTVSGASSSSASVASDGEFAVMLRMMQLAQSYGIFDESARSGSRVQTEA